MLVAILTVHVPPARIQVQRHNKFEAFLFHSIHNILSSSLSLNPEI
jgi:hypothetical protein